MVGGSTGEIDKKETDGLGIKDQSSRTLFMVVGQGNDRGVCVHFPDGGDFLLLVEAWR